METSLVASLIQSTVLMAVPLLLAAEGELLAERAGLVNIGLEGMILAGAFAALWVAHGSGNAVAGAAAAAVVGIVLGLLYAGMVLWRGGNQVVVGTALNLLALGATGVGYRAAFGVTGAAITVEGLTPWPLPLLSSLPWIGGALFDQPWLGYLAFLLVPGLAWWVRHTLAGLSLRMVGEDPRAAAAQGVAVRRVQTGAMIACGALAGLAGAYLALAYARTFVEGMSAGRGFIALAIVIFGRWSPWGILGAALTFGMATALQFYVQALGLPIPYQVPLLLPYVLTLLVLALARGGQRGPAALGRQPVEAV